MKWASAKIGEITQVVSGTTPSSEKKEYWNGTHVWITPTDLGRLDGIYIDKSERLITDQAIKSSNLPLVPKGSVVMSSRAPIGHLGLAKVDLFTNQGCKSFVCSKAIDSEYLFYHLKYRIKEIQELGSGSIFAEVSKSILESFEIHFPQDIKHQKQISTQIKSQLAEVEKARKAVKLQLCEVESLGNAIVFDSTRKGKTKTALIGDVLDEIKKGVGENWHEHLVLGATRNGLALAKEPPGKNPQRYKHVVPGTIFYNPMRIMIGSIAMVDDGDIQGITSPDYVVLKGGEGKVDSRWFYYWLRSPLGKHCINTLARGAVRERMLFNRLANGEIELPDYKVQLKASESLKQLRQLKSTFTQGLKELELIPDKLLKQVFDGFALNN